MEKKEQGALSRKKFLKTLGVVTAIIAVPATIYRKDLESYVQSFVNKENINLDKEMRNQIGIARSLAHQPPLTYKGFSVPLGSEYQLRRAGTLSLINTSIVTLGEVSWPGGLSWTQEQLPEISLHSNGPEFLYNALTVEIPKVGLNGYKDLSKDTLSAVGGSLGFVGTLAAALVPEIVIPMAVVSAVGGGIGVYANLKDDANTTKIIDQSNLQIAQALWNDPAAEAVMQGEVKNLLKDVFGVDFGASIEEHKAYLPEQVKKYVDIYLEAGRLTEEEREEALTLKVTEAINNSLETAINKVVIDMQERQLAEEERQREKLYNDGEIRGSIYLASFIAEKLIGGNAGNIVSTLGNSALQASSIISSLSMGAMGPVGAAAGFLNIAIGIAGLFGKSGPTADQMILESIGKLQESIHKLHQEMRELFGVVIENQQAMMERINLQFEILKEKQDQALKQLTEIQEDLRIIIDEDRRRGRDLQTTELIRVTQSLKTEINKKLSRIGVVEIGNVETAIEECRTYGLETALYTDFTGLPRPGDTQLRWDSKKIVEYFDTIDLVDHSVGILPTLARRFGQINISPVHNPKALARASITLSVAYSAFPEVANIFEVGSLHYLQDFNTAIANTRNSLSQAVNKDVIRKFKIHYLNIVDSILDNALSEGERQARNKNNITDDATMNISAQGPFNEITLETLQSFEKAGWFDGIPTNSVLEKEVFVRNGHTCSDWIGEGQPYNPQICHIGSYRLLGINGLVESQNYISKIDDFFKYLDFLNIARLEAGQTRNESISFSYDLKVGTEIGVFRSHNTFTAREKITPHKVFFPQEGVTLGDGINTGWIASKIEDQRRITHQPVPNESTDEAKNIYYMSSSLFGHERVGNSSIDFLIKLKNNVNLFYNVRQDIIRNTCNTIEDRNNSMSLEFEAAAMSLKYLAGINTYLKTGDSELGTAIFKDRVIGVNRYLNVNNASNLVVEEQKKTNLLSTRKDISDLISEITTYKYIYNPAVPGSANQKNIEIKEYIKSEAKRTIEQFFQEYTDLYFAEDDTVFNLTELTIPQMMLATAASKLNVF